MLDSKALRAMTRPSRSIGVGTVKIHLHHVFEKLHLRGRHDLQVYLREKMY